MTDESYFSALRRKVGQQLLLCPSVAAVILDEAGRLSLQEKGSGEGWSLPAGAIEPGETPQAAIQREVLEETGWEVEISNIIGVYGGKDFRYMYPSGDRVEYVVTVFRCQISGGDGIPRDSETRRTAYFAEKECPPLAVPYPKDVLFPR